MFLSQILEFLARHLKKKSGHTIYYRNYLQVSEIWGINYQGYQAWVQRDDYPHNLASEPENVALQYTKICYF